MSSYPIDTTIPFADNYPGDDQPGMQTNFSNINSYVQVDHTDPAGVVAGLHKQVTFNNKNAQGAQTDPQSVVYTAAGGASTVSQLIHKNENKISALSALSAFGYFSAAGSPATILNQFNLGGAPTKSSTGIWSCSLQSGSVIGTSYIVEANAFLSGVPLIVNYQIISNTVFRLNFYAIINSLPPFQLTDPTTFNFVVYQY